MTKSGTFAKCETAKSETARSERKSFTFFRQYLFMSGEPLFYPSARIVPCSPNMLAVGHVKHQTFPRTLGPCNGRKICHGHLRGVCIRDYVLWKKYLLFREHVDPLYFLLGRRREVERQEGFGSRRVYKGTKIDPPGERSADEDENCDCFPQERFKSPQIGDSTGVVVNTLPQKKKKISTVNDPT